MLPNSVLRSLRFSAGADGACFSNLTSQDKSKQTQCRVKSSQAKPIIYEYNQESCVPTLATPF